MIKEWISLCFPKKTINKIFRRIIFLGILIILYMLIVNPIVKGIKDSYEEDKATITNKEWQQFQEWDKKQQQKQFENSPIK